MKLESIRHYIAWRAAQELKTGIVNLGIGIPTLVADYLTPGKVTLHSENGILGVGAAPAEGFVDRDLINAGKQPITQLPHTSFFDSSLSFAMMRGGHLDATVIGALQVAENGDIASWAIPGKDVLGVGGVMDLVAGAKKVIVTTTHLNAKGEPKILPRCTYPLTAKGRVDTVITEYAVFKIRSGQLYLEEIVAGISLDELKQITPASYEVSANLQRVNAFDLVK
ncbi:3-oxoacid CoA-transferase subunit B [Peribacillus asahii]|uniref:3-oxoacid CoA-transferase subunit B n=1 Tax=Peribacillus asahii TaxID=228899 RepID=UPI0020799BC2|nr:3-oxoacid CoA-transferase subunit B [Peribacillus asahii]USK72179.1 3-oxoacid CoA-transferase subunit B [Peribacillus asahii]